MKPQRLLVPVDFSDSSARALRHAVKLAAESGGSLTIVHVVPFDYGWLGNRT
jgi:nucleotide-binding universal stress UspA family protein